VARAPQGPPEGYRERAIGGTLLVAHDSVLDALSTALGMGTLHAWASAQPNAEAMHGRGISWATRLPNGREIVVRHSRHGGMLAALTRDLFLAPTRAPDELAVSLRLRAAGVATPEVIGYAVYGALGPLCRADVVSARLPGMDLPAALAAHTSKDERHAISVAVSRLLADLRQSRAIHHDLNAKNILITATGGEFQAWVIDVDRVTFDGRERISGMRNVERLGRSLAKWREEHRLELAPSDLVRMMSLGGPDRVEFRPPGE
jgi:tRNA A-37 threonylcarbamoyl transferase component Bud32